MEPHETAYVGDAVSDVGTYDKKVVFVGTSGHSLWLITGELTLSSVMAKQAGSIAVALLCGMGTEAHLRSASPDHIFGSLKDFADHLLQHRGL